MELQIIARIRNGYSSKFGIPRQSGLAEGVLSQIVFEPPFRQPDALRGIEAFDYLWLVWEFTEAKRQEGESKEKSEDKNGQEEKFIPTVRPPKLGGNRRMGVFATRSPFRPNRLGLSSVKLLAVHPTATDGAYLTVGGADLLDGTPLYDIKPYLAYTDSHPEARGGFADGVRDNRLAVHISAELARELTAAERLAIEEILAQDPRPGYQHSPDRVYGFPYGGREIRFLVDDASGVATVISAERM